MRESKNNPNWNPDQDFIDFIESELAAGLAEDSHAGLDTAMIGSSDGSQTGRDIIQEMRDGTRDGRALYDNMRNNPANKQPFENWKKQNGRT